MRFPKKLIDLWLPLFIFLGALTIRLWNFSDIEFKLDESLAIFRAVQFWFTGRLPLSGLISSIGIVNPPLFLYLLLPITLVSLNPLLVTFIFSLCGCLAILVLYQVLKRYSSLVAFFSTLLFASSPWPILFSRKIWAQNLLPLFSTLLVYFSYRFLIEKRNRAVLPLITLSSWASQIHFSGLLTLPFVLMILISTKVKIKSKEVILGLIIGLLPLVPYVIFQIKNGLVNLSYFLKGWSQIGSGLDIYSLINPFRIIAGFSFDIVLGG